MGPLATRTTLQSSLLAASFTYMNEKSTFPERARDPAILSQALIADGNDNNDDSKHSNYHTSDTK